MIIVISATYDCNANACIELPVENWSEIKKWYIKWDRFHYTLDGEEWVEEDLNSEAMGGIDWKRPTFTYIYNEETNETLEEQ